MPREKFKNTGSNEVHILLLAYTETDAKFMAGSQNYYARDLFVFKTLFHFFVVNIFLTQLMVTVKRSQVNLIMSVHLQRKLIV